MLNKIVRNGKVAVIYHPSFGAGWYSWHGILELLFDPQVVTMLENDADSKTISEYCEKTYPPPYYNGYFSCKNLKIGWVTVGSKFRIQEYDGSERIVELSEENYITA